jgi:hypothetical protein
MFASQARTQASAWVCLITNMALLFTLNNPKEYISNKPVVIKVPAAC